MARRVPRPGEAATSVGDTPPRVTSSPRESSTGDTGTRERVRPSRGESPPVSPKTATKKDTELQSDLAQMYRMCAMMTMMFNRPLGESVMENSDAAADAWVQLAQRNPKVKKALIDMTTASVWGGVVSVHVQMFAPVLAGVIGTHIPSVPTNQPPQPVYQAGPVVDPIAQTPMSEETIEAQLAFLQATDPQAYALAMMALGRDTETGGPGDTVRVTRNGNGNAVQMPDLSKPDL